MNMRRNPCHFFLILGIRRITITGTVKWFNKRKGFGRGAESTRVRERAFGEIYLVQGNFWKTIASCDDFLKNYCIWRSF